MENEGYDIIGDIHGHADELKQLLTKLGYSEASGVYAHPTRTAIILGDFINKGPQQAETVRIVRAMQQAGAAKVILGNHELDAILLATPHDDGYTRPHNEKNLKRHADFLNAFPVGSQANKDIVQWLKTLPLFLDTQEFNCAHACFCDNAYLNIQPYLSNDGSIREDAYPLWGDKTSSFYSAIERFVRGVVYQFPNGQEVDCNGYSISSLPLKWWEEGANSLRLDFIKNALTPEQYAQIDAANIARDLSPARKKTFIGHYESGANGVILTEDLAGLDMAVVREDGYLGAYRFNAGDENLHESRVVSVPNRDQQRKLERDNAYRQSHAPIPESYFGYGLAS